MKLFDLDGTLIDSNGVWVEIDHLFLDRRGLPLTEEYIDVVGHSIFPIAARFTRDYYHLSETPEEIMAEWTGWALDAYAHRVPVKPGVTTFLERERRKGETLVIVTACVPEMCRTALERLELTDYFSRIFFAQEYGMEKRDPRFFSLVVEALGVSPETCTLYEDAPDNCAAARAAGLTVVGVQDDFYSARERDVIASCDRYIRSFEELL